MDFSTDVPGFSAAHAQPLSNIKNGSLCFVGEEEWCACVFLEEGKSLTDFENLRHIMIGGAKDLTHYVIPVSRMMVKQVKNDSLMFVQCLVSGLGLVYMGPAARMTVIG